MKKLIFISILSIGIVCLFSCKKEMPVENTPLSQEINNLDGSAGLQYEGEETETMSTRASSFVFIDFNDLDLGITVQANQYADLGVYVMVGPNGTTLNSYITTADYTGPCNASPSIKTDPFTGPSILFNFLNPVANVSLESGDFGPSDADAITLSAYSGLNATGLIASTTVNLGEDVPTGCLNLSIIGTGIRSIEITDDGTIMGNSLYPNSMFVDNLYFDQIYADIDIKPGSYPNSINCKNTHQNIPVAILSTETFDALTVDHTTVYFEGAMEWHMAGGEMVRHEEDVNEDGLIDLVFHFKLAQTYLDCESIIGTLVGFTYDGIYLQGSDEVTMR